MGVELRNAADIAVIFVDLTERRLKRLPPGGGLALVVDFFLVLVRVVLVCRIGVGGGEGQQHVRHGEQSVLGNIAQHVA